MWDWIILAILIAVALFFEWDVRRLRKKNQHKHDWWSVELYTIRSGKLSDSQGNWIGDFRECTAKVVCKTCKAGRLVEDVEIWEMLDGTTKAFHAEKELHINDWDDD